MDTVYSQHEIFRPFRIERLPVYAGRLDEPGGNGRNAVPVFPAPVTAATRSAASFFSLETQSETGRKKNAHGPRQPFDMSNVSLYETRRRIGPRNDCFRRIARTGEKISAIHETINYQVPSYRRPIPTNGDVYALSVSVLIV